MSLQQNPQIVAFLATVCAQIKCREVHPQISLELLGHLEELVAEAPLTQLSEAEAVDQAIRQMGDPVTLGQQLHQAHRPRVEWGLLGLVGLFLGLGLFLLYSIESQGLLIGRSSFSPFSNSLIWVALGLVSSLGLYFFDYRKIKPFSIHLFGATSLVWLMIFIFRTASSNGKLFIHLGPVQIDFISITPFLFAVALAGIFANWDWRQTRNLFKASVLLAVPCLLYLHSHDASAAVVYAVVFMVLMLASGGRRIKPVLVVGVSAIIPLAVALPLMLQPYQIQRWAAFLDPYGDALGSGYAIVQSMEAIRSAGLWGQGFTLPPRMIPEIHTDLVFTYLVYSFGWIAALAFLALVITLISRLTRVAARTKDEYGRLVVIGIISLFSVQFLWNMAMTLGLVPLAAFSLPFISYGGSQLIMQMAAVGLVLSVYRRQDMVGSSPVGSALGE